MSDDQRPSKKARIGSSGCPPAMLNGLHFDEASQSDGQPNGVYEKPRILPSMIAHTTFATVPSATKQFFRNPDMCTHFTKVMHRDTRSLLAFRSITRQSFNAVMHEKTSQKGLMLVPAAQGFHGVLTYRLAPPNDPACFLSLFTAYGPCPKVYPFISHEEADISKLQTTFNSYRYLRRDFEIITLHPALQFIHCTSALKTTLFFHVDHNFFNPPPLHLDMFLTQPPQEVIVATFGGTFVRNVSPKLLELAQQSRIEVAGGIRLRDVIAHYLARASAETFRNCIIMWTYEGAIAENSTVAKRAASNSARCAEGAPDFSHYWGHDPLSFS